MPAGRLVNVPATAEVYCRRARGDGPERAVRVVYREPESGDTQDGLAVGQLFYAASPPARSEIVNGYRRIHVGPIRWDRAESLQGVEHEPSLAVQFIRELQAHRADGNTTSFAHRWASKHGDFHELGASRQLDNAFAELQADAPHTSLVGHSQWGAFMREQFDAMETGAYQHFVLSSHRKIAVAAELAVLDTPRGKRYMVSLFDPEFPLTHSRIVEDDLEQVEQWTAASFMRSSLYRSDTADEIALFSAVPPDFHTRPLTGPLPEETPRARVFEDKFLNAQQRDSPFAVFQMALAGHLTEDALRERLAHCPTDSAKRELIAAKSPSGLSGLSAAALRGEAVAVRAFGRVMHQAWTEGYVSDSEFVDLLSGHEPTSLLHWALLGGKADMVAVIGDMLWDVTVSNGLGRGLLHTERERIANLVVGGTDASALARAMASGRADAVDAYRKVLGRARAGGLITPDETYEALDLFSYPGGTLNLGAEQIKAFDDMLADPQLAPDLTGADVKDLLASLLDAIAMREERAKMDVPDVLIQEFKATVKRARTRGQLSEADVRELDRAIDGGVME
ncbi:ShET2/EspL2 family type III secretion system effector toxin [Trinickia sp. LjRoot230]|uniref:ShET2/EspL2 family type III secretion system effector toxin n=1 Tax=Trinickia sp. LjRoot230 TaxID=3342288 RepID=UPI003ED02FB3